MIKSKKKNPAAVALSDLSRRKRMSSMTAAQRSEQGKKAVAARRDRQKGIWFGLLVFPDDCREGGGVEKLAPVLDEAHSNTGKVVFWSQDRAEVVRYSRENDLREREIDIIEQEWDPHLFRVKREFKFDADSLRQLLRVDVEGARR